MCEDGIPRTNLMVSAYLKEKPEDAPSSILTIFLYGELMKLPDYTLQSLDYISETIFSKTTINICKTAALVIIGIVIGLTI